MDPQFVLTTAGLAAASTASPTGPHIVIAMFRVGTGYNYTPAASDTGLHGSVLYEGTPTSFAFVADDTAAFVCELPPTVGPFDYGEIGLYLDDGTLFALAAYPVRRSKLNISISGQPHLVRFNCLIKLAQSPAIFNVTTTSSSTLLEVSSFSLVTPPQHAPSGVNAVIVQQALASGQSTLLVKKSATEWTPVGWEHVANCTISAVVSATQVQSADFAKYAYASAGSDPFLFQDSLGNVRVVSAITGTTLSLNNGIPVTGGVGTTCKLYRVPDKELDIVPAEATALWSLMNQIWSTNAVVNTGEGPGVFVGPSWSPVQAGHTHYGWGQTALSTPNPTTGPTNAQWVELKAAIQKAAAVTGVRNSTVVGDYFKTPMETPSNYHRTRALIRYEQALFDIAKNRFNVPKNSLEYTTVAGRTLAFTAATPWEKLNFDLTYTFASEAAIGAFFTAGGYIDFTVRSSRNSYIEWVVHRVFSLLGPIRFKYDGVESMGPLRLKFSYGDGHVTSYGPLGFIGMTPNRKRMFSYMVPLNGKKEAGVGGGGQGRADEMFMVELYATRDNSTNYIMKLEFFVYQTSLDLTGVPSPTNPPFILGHTDPATASRITITDDPINGTFSDINTSAWAAPSQRINAYNVMGRPLASLLNVPYPLASVAGSTSWGVDNPNIGETSVEKPPFYGADSSVETF